MALSSSRLPQINVLANGITVDGVLDVEISSNSFLCANRYRLSVALDSSGYDTWVGDDIVVTIAVGLAGEWQTLMVGPIDQISIDVGAGLVHVDGRDFTARFIEARTQETFENSTSSEIVTTLALRRGLSCNVTPTFSLVGRDFGGDHSRTTFDQYSGITTEWDLLAKLADLEQFDVWVDGEVLSFAPPAQDMTPLRFSPQCCSSIRLDRQLSLCSGLQVIVKSWDCRGQKAVFQMAGPSDGKDRSRSYIIIKPNLTDQSAASLASRTLAQVGQNARLITLELPGEINIKPRQALSLTQTGTDFDGMYVVTSIERHLSFEHGFTETLQARTPPWTAFSTI